MKKLLFILLFLHGLVHAQIKHTFYTIVYDSAERGPDYTEYWLTKAKLKHVAKRPAAFTNDPAIDKSLQSTNATYRNSGYDKGHLSPADDFKFDQEAELESMYLTNVAPQNSYFNEHLWKGLEDHVRQEAELYDSEYVVTGVIYGDKKLKGVGIPTYYWKEIRYNGTTEYFLGENVHPKSNDYKSIEVDECTFKDVTQFFEE